MTIWTNSLDNLYHFVLDYCHQVIVQEQQLSYQQTAKQDGLPRANYFYQRRLISNEFQWTWKYIISHSMQCSKLALKRNNEQEYATRNCLGSFPSHSRLFNYVYVGQSLPHALFFAHIIFFSSLCPPFWKKDIFIFNRIIIVPSLYD